VLANMHACICKLQLRHSFANENMYLRRISTDDHMMLKFPQKSDSLPKKISKPVTN
jgi:hypothetical protein